MSIRQRLLDLVVEYRNEHSGRNPTILLLDRAAEQDLQQFLVEEDEWRRRRRDLCPPEPFVYEFEPVPSARDIDRFRGIAVRFDGERTRAI